MEQLMEYLKVLADPTRIKIIKFLLQGDMYVCELVEVMGVTQPTVSQHLRRLKAVGLVEENKEGQRIRYRLVKDKMEEYEATLKCFLAKPIYDIPQMQPEWERYQKAVAGGIVLTCCLAEEDKG
ncbi:MAG: winged helix-turn-helix transcriptional regulator [Clostridia bacterium]|nr:winged helix-turn-helix transcriptional regulator [Clostridia bacterium]